MLSVCDDRVCGSAVCDCCGVRGSVLGGGGGGGWFRDQEEFGEC